MLQVPSTSQNQLPDRCGDMIQFQDGKRDAGVAASHVFQVFTIIQPRRIYMARAGCRHRTCRTTKRPAATSGRLRARRRATEVKRTAARQSQPGLQLRGAAVAGRPSTAAPPARVKRHPRGRGRSQFSWGGQRRQQN